MVDGHMEISRPIKEDDVAVFSAIKDVANHR